MKRLTVRAMLLGSLCVPGIAQAQEAAPSGAANVQQAQIDALQEQVKALQAQLDSIKAGMVKQTPALEKPAEKSWSADTKIGGKAYMNVSMVDHESDGVNQADNGVQTDVKRFYLTVDHRFDDTFSANLTTDFRYNSKGLNNDVTVYVKKAYLQAKLSDAAIFRVGSADLPWVPFVEDLYGYRYVEQVITDRTKYATSADWGVHFRGSVLGGKLEYAASAINGAGYKTLGRTGNGIDLEGRVSFKPVEYLVFAVGGYSGTLGKDNAVTDARHRATRVNALAAYVGKRGRLGVEYFRANNWNNVTSLTKDRSSGVSAFGSFNVDDKLAVFARYDWLNPDQKTNDALSENYFNIGASYAVTKGVDLALVYKRDRVENGFVSTSNGTIGGIDDGSYDELGVWTQLKF